MTLGVYERVQQLKDDTIIPLPRKYIHLIPLVEVIANSLGIKSVTSAKIINVYNEILKRFPSEIKLWLAEEKEIRELLDKYIPQKTMNAIIAVKNEKFEFSPPGYDGEYGKLKIEI